MTPIFGPTTTTQDQAFAWARKRGAHERAFSIIPLYYRHAPRYGIPAENAIGQSSWETNDWKYTGAVKPEQHNMAGIKTRTATGDRPEDHATFADAEQGVIAHLQHLARYGGKAAAQLPDPIVDPRFDLVTKFTSTMEGLGGAWAPAASYGRNVASRIAELRATEVPAMVDISGFTLPHVTQQWFEPNGISYLGEDMQMRGVCIHQTGNTSPTAEAQQNVNYMKSQAAIDRQASWHATVGKDIIIETIPDTKQAFHASDGGGPGNTHFFAVEGVMCYRVGTPEFERVLQNHAWYTALKLRTKGLPLTFAGRNGTVAQHNDFAPDRKNCPQMYRDTGQWERFKAFVQAFYDRNEWGSGSADPNSLKCPTGHYIVNQRIGDRWIDMLDRWTRRGGLAVCGWAQDGMQAVEETLSDGSTVLTYRQVFDNVGIAIYPDGSDRFFGIGMELVELRARIAELERAA